MNNQQLKICDVNICGFEANKNITTSICGINVCQITNPFPCKTIVDIVSENESLSTLVSLLPSSVIELLNGSEYYTLLAPSNHAFEQIAQLAPLLSQQELLNILKYHVLPGIYRSSDLCNCKDIETLLTYGCCNQSIKVLSNDCGVAFIGSHSQSSVICPDLEAVNGIVHIIDTVLIPKPKPLPFRNIFEILVSNLNNKPLSRLFSLLPNSVVELLSTSDNYTLLAPSDTAFEAIIETVLSLTPEQLLTILKHHVISGKVLSSDLSPEMVVNTLLSPEDNDQTLTVNINNENVKFIATNSEALVDEADIQAINEVIHIINTVLLP